jgi:type VI secretion system secreted protein Hcp
MAIDVYLKFISDIEGESTDDKHKTGGWIECKSVSFGVKQPKSATSSTAGGHTAERCEQKELVFTKLADMASPSILLMCSMGKTIKSAELHFMRANGDGVRVQYYTVKLENVVVSDVTADVVEGDIMHESVALKFSKIEWEYKQQKIDGSAGGSKKGWWDASANKGGK